MRCSQRMTLMYLFPSARQRGTLYVGRKNLGKPRKPRADRAQPLPFPRTAYFAIADLGVTSLDGIHIPPQRLAHSPWSAVTRPKGPRQADRAVVSEANEPRRYRFVGRRYRVDQPARGRAERYLGSNFPSLLVSRERSIRQRHSTTPFDIGERRVREAFSVVHWASPQLSAEPCPVAAQTRRAWPILASRSASIAKASS